MLILKYLYIIYYIICGVSGPRGGKKEPFQNAIFIGILDYRGIIIYEYYIRNNVINYTKRPSSGCSLSNFRFPHINWTHVIILIIPRMLFCINCARIIFQLLRRYYREFATGRPPPVVYHRGNRAIATTGQSKFMRA